MVLAVVDTHALIWYIFKDPRMSPTARSFLDGLAAAGDEAAVSSMSLVEIVYLIEKHRIDPTTFDQVRALLNTRGLLVEAMVDQSVAFAMRTISRAQVPDMPDRVIAATALSLGVPLVSRDGRISASSVAIIW